MALGFRLFKITSGIVGFIFGFFFLFFLIMYCLTDTNRNAVWIGLGSGIGLGIALGLIMFFFPIVALVVLSAFVGVVFGIILYEIALMYIGWPPVYYISMAVGGVLFLILGLIIKKFFIILMTSLYGAFAICYGVATFAGGFPIFVDTTAVGYQRPANYWLVYIYFAGIIVGTVVGTIVQYCLTARGLSWEEVRASACPRSRKGTSLRREDQEDNTVPLISGSGTTKKTKKKKKSTKGEY